MFPASAAQTASQTWLAAGRIDFADGVAACLVFAGRLTRWLHHRSRCPGRRIRAARIADGPREEGAVAIPGGVAAERVDRADRVATGRIFATGVNHWPRSTSRWRWHHRDPRKSRRRRSRSSCPSSCSRTGRPETDRFAAGFRSLQPRRLVRRGGSPPRRGRPGREAVRVQAEQRRASRRSN